MHPTYSVAVGAACLGLVFGLAWLRQRRTRNAGMVDPVWSWALGFLGLL